MPIDETKTCNMHTNEKKDNGICCQIKDEQENAEQQTYEHSLMSLNIHELAKSNPTKTYIELETMKKQNDFSKI